VLTSLRSESSAQRPSGRRLIWKIESKG